MICLDESRIDQLVLAEINGQAIPVEEQKHLENCSFCRSRYVELRSIYRSTLDKMKSPASEKVGSFGDDLNRGKTRAREFLVAFMPLQDQTLMQNDTRIAAGGGRRSEKPRFIDRGALSTDDGGLVVRLMEDNESGELSMSLISREQSRTANVMLTLQPSGRNYVSDKNGRIDLGKTTLEDLDRLAISIRTPEATFDLKPLVSETDEVIQIEPLLLENQFQDRIRVVLVPKQGEYALHIRIEKVGEIESGTQLKIALSRGTWSEVVDSRLGSEVVFNEVDDLAAVRVQIFRSA